MLGRTIADPDGVEGAPGAMDGFGYLDCTTILAGEKTLTHSRGRLLDSDVEIEGYEIHMGITERGNSQQPAVRVVERQGQPVDDADGAVSDDGCVWGTYFHGLFDAPVARRAFLLRLRPDLSASTDEPEPQSVSEHRDRQYDLLAEHLRQYVDVAAIGELVGLSL